MSNTTVKLQIPLDKSLRDQVEKHARKMGFSSVQDFTRVLYSTVLEDNMKLSMKPAEVEYISPKTAKRLDRQAKQAIRDYRAGKLKAFDNVEDFLADLKKL
ncbi:hypothetical protein HYW35_02485 [Candidatus Saccharibacteria bacterium]|nr:hypothetical protein [Candidatus Saccharibacteria bacterium]